MSESGSTSRAKRNRRFFAVFAWSSLVVAAILLWNGRHAGLIRSEAPEPVVFLLSGYAMFVSIFAWMLFAPDRRLNQDFHLLVLSAAATLATPCAIAFALMPSDSPLRGWLAFVLLVSGCLALLSPIPKQFFAIPRDRESYLRAGPDFQLMRQSVPNAPSLDRLLYQLSRTDEVRMPVRPRAEFPSEPLPDTRSFSDQLQAERDQWLADDRALIPTRHQKKPRAAVPRNEAVRRPTREERRPPNIPRKSSSHSRPPANTNIKPSPSAVTFNRQVRPEARRREPLGPQLPLPILPPTLPSPPGRATSVDTESDLQIISEEARSSREIASDRLFSSTADVTDSIGFRQEQVTATERNEARSPEAAGEPDSSGVIELHRSTDEFGGELVEGTARVRFRRGQKRARVHIAFDPPLNGPPQVECESVGETPVRVRAGTAQPYGIRLDVRRRDAGRDLETDIGFAAVWSPNL